MKSDRAYRYFIHLAYNGALFHGWQIQENANSVQGDLIKAISLLLRENIYVIGCGRTDTGVHASSFYAHFDTDQLMSQQHLDQLAFKLNRFLGDSIVIYKIYQVSLDLHARFSAKERSYHYYINTVKNPFKTQFSYFFHQKLDVNRMNEACEVLYSYRDFSSFSKSGTQTKTNNCKINHAQWQRKEDALVFEIRADRFLRNMVRAIVGTLLEVGVGKMSISDFKQVIESKNRSKAGYSVPGHALFLSDVKY